MFDVARIRRCSQIIEEHELLQHCNARPKYCRLGIFEKTQASNQDILLGLTSSTRFSNVGRHDVRCHFGLTALARMLHSTLVLPTFSPHQLEQILKIVLRSTFGQEQETLAHSHLNEILAVFICNDERTPHRADSNLDSNPLP